MEGIGMIWPLAAEYARRGWAVRRAGWEDPYIATGAPPASNSLRWIVYQNALFHLIYQERDGGSIGARIIRTVRNADFTENEFRADDWTVLAPSCLASGGASGNPDQQGFMPYPQDGTESPNVDPQYPNLYFGTCPTVPPVVPAKGGGLPPIFPNPNPGPEPNPVPPTPPNGGGGGGRSSRRRSPRPSAAPISVTLVTSTPCPMGDIATEVITLEVALGAAPTPAADGIYWVTVVCNGTVERLSLSPGDAVNLSFTVTGRPGIQNIIIQATAYLPVRRLTSRDTLTKVMNSPCTGYYVTLYCAGESCHDGTGRLTVDTGGGGLIYNGCPGLGNTFIDGELDSLTEITLSYDGEDDPCEYHCCDNAVFGVMLGKHVEGVSPDAFVYLGDVSLNNAIDCGSRSRLFNITQEIIDTLNAP